MLASSSARYQGLAHLFQGAIDLEQSGIAGARGQWHGGAEPIAQPARPKLRASALEHLKTAAAQLPERRRGPGALRRRPRPHAGTSPGPAVSPKSAWRWVDSIPNTKFWAAWSIVQAGYPEEAEPIVHGLLGEITQGRLPREMEGPLHLLSGEISQAKRSPADLKKALAEFEKLSAHGQISTPAVELRLAQIEVQLGRRDDGLKHLEKLRAHGQGSPAVEHLAFVTLREQGRAAEARKLLASARQRYPQSDELVGLEATLLAKDKKPQQADRVLAEYLTKNPERLGIVLMRAQILADVLDQPQQRAPDPRRSRREER